MASFNSEAGRHFWRIAWPASLEGLIVNLLFAADLMMVGALGRNATSAVGIFAQPKMLLLCLPRSFAVAVAALIAIRLGQGEVHQLSRCLKQSVVLAAAGAAVLLGLALTFLEPMLKLAGAASDYLPLAMNYAVPALFSLFFTALTTVLNAGLLGIGQTRIIMAANIIGNVCNVALNFALIEGRLGFPAWGVFGAGIATLAGSVVCFAISLAVLLSPTCPVNLLGSAHWKPQRTEIKALGSIFGGAFAEQGAERFGMFVYSRMTAELGTLAFATHTIAMNLCDLYYSFAQGMGKAALVLSGQARGANDHTAFAATAKAGQRIGGALSAVAFALYFLLRQPMLGWFVSDAQIIALGQQIMLIVAVVSFPEAHAHICAGTLRGAGKTRFVAAYSLVSIALLRPIVTWVLCFGLNLGLHGAWLALLLDQALRAACAHFGVRQLLKQTQSTHCYDLAN